jgi:hypothetical protein
VKKVIATTVLGIALLVASGVANAEETRAAEPRWGIRSDRSSVSSPLDLARWLARRLSEGIAVPVLLPPIPAPRSAPVTGPMPNDGEGDAICPPERAHCPVG